MDQVEPESYKEIIILAVLAQLGLQLIINRVEEEFLGITDVLVIILVKVFHEIVVHGHPFLDVDWGMVCQSPQTRPQLVWLDLECGQWCQVRTGPSAS